MHEARRSARTQSEKGKSVVFDCLPRGYAEIAGARGPLETRSQRTQTLTRNPGPDGDHTGFTVPTCRDRLRQC